MTKQDVVLSVYTGKLVQCELAEYETIRRYLQEISGDFIDNGDGFRSMIALNEVRRLDKKFNYQLPLSAV